MRKLFFPAAALALSLAAPAGAQQPQPPRYLLLHQEVAKPSMVAQYEAAAKEFIALVKAHRDKMPHFFFETLMAPDFTYTYVLPLASMAMLDTVNAEFGAMAQAAGAAFAEQNRRGGAATDHWKESVVQLAAELSYRPAAPRLKPEEIKYFHYDLYYVMPGREQDADALAADYVKLFKSKNASSGYSLYKAVIGPEMPLYAVAVGAKDAADFLAEDARLQALLGAEGQALSARAASLMRRFEQREAVRRPDLSLVP